MLIFGYQCMSECLATTLALFQCSFITQAKMKEAATPSEEFIYYACFFASFEKQRTRLFLKACSELCQVECTC